MSCACASAVEAGGLCKWQCFCALEIPAEQAEEAATSPLLLLLLANGVGWSSWPASFLDDAEPPLQRQPCQLFRIVAQVICAGPVSLSRQPGALTQLGAEKARSSQQASSLAPLLSVAKSRLRCLKLTLFGRAIEWIRRTKYLCLFSQNLYGQWRLVAEQQHQRERLETP